jgi:hypothetical protein
MLVFTSLSEKAAAIRITWVALQAEGFDCIEVQLGIWDGPRNYNVQFFSRGKAIESFSIPILNAHEFDALRSEAKQLARNLFSHREKNFAAASDRDLT